MSTRTAPIRLAGAEMCRLTVQTPTRRCDVALPVVASIGELLPLVIDETGNGAEADGTWVLQRLGGPALDPGATPESLGLYDGAVLYVNPAEMPLPEAEYDDVSVGVAELVAGRRDQWRPEFSRYLLLAAALLATGTLCVVAVTGRPDPLEMLWCALAGMGLTGWAVLARQVFEDPVTSLACGFAACAIGVLTGLGLAHPTAPLLTLDHRSVALTGLCVFVPASICAVLGGLPLTPFGGVTAWAAIALLGPLLDSSFGWTATQCAAVIAVWLFAFGGRGVRAALRFARLRAPLLPRTATELQQDIEPDRRAVVAARSERAVDYINILFLVTALLVDVACVLLSRETGWIGWTLALVLSAAALLRSAAVTSAWQRAPLAVAGLVGIAAVVIARTSGLGVPNRSLVLFGLLLGCVGLYVLSLMLPGRRMLPVWGQFADLLELWSAIALVPLLLQLFHVYTRIRDLIH